MAESYVGGLLHACGKLILSANFPSKYVEVNKMVEDDGMPLLDAEVKIFGAHHGRLAHLFSDSGAWQVPLWRQYIGTETLPAAFQLIFNHLLCSYPYILLNIWQSDEEEDLPSTEAFQ